MTPVLEDVSAGDRVLWAADNDVGVVSFVNSDTVYVEWTKPSPHRVPYPIYVWRVDLRDGEVRLIELEEFL